MKKKNRLGGKGINEVGRRADTNEVVIKLILDILDLQKLINFLETQKKAYKLLGGNQKYL